MTVGLSWGRWPRHKHRICPVASRFDELPERAPMLAFGNGRSYGDVCQNDGGTLLLTRGLDRFISFDHDSGVLECEAGVLLSEIIELTLPQGWFPAVIPGTAMVTVGGAIANDVHGKNHHRAGSFGHHVLEFELQRSDGQILRCSPDVNRDWFAATIGGLGLTGLIRRARLQLRRVPGVWIAGDSRRFAGLEEFFELAAESDAHYEYTVAWLDCAAGGARLGRGVFMRGNHVFHQAEAPTQRPARAVPITPPLSPVNAVTVRLFNELYFRRPAAQQSNMRWHYRRYLFPLDGLLEWNRMYGPAGFFQYQCVLPGTPAQQLAALREMLQLIASSRQASFLVVLKQFGDMPSLGLLSFPRPGVSLALDFPNRGAPTLALLERLDSITRASGGAVYPAKDARMSAQSFRQYFPRWQQLQPFIDPKFSSSFWRRVTESAA
ncbi:MAG: FAD-binding oxidoreductase [Steroidobacteraceae bacterium]